MHYRNSFLNYALSHYLDQLVVIYFSVSILICHLYYFLYLLLTVHVCTICIQHVMEFFSTYKAISICVKLFKRLFQVLLIALHLRTHKTSNKLRIINLSTLININGIEQLNRLLFGEVNNPQMCKLTHPLDHFLQRNKPVPIFIDFVKNIL